MWELELIPVYLLLSMWGGKKRFYDATKFISYTAGGSIFIFIGALTMGLYGSIEPTLDFQILANKSYPIELEVILYLSFSIVYANKLPIELFIYIIRKPIGMVTEPVNPSLIQ
jgi:NAD(P)H-quinone oxidoreductase subunit 4